MLRGRVGRWGWAALLAVLAAGCAARAGDDPVVASGQGLPAVPDLTTTTATTAPPTTTTAAPPPTTAAPPPPTTVAPAPPVTLPRVLVEQPWTPYATTGSVVLHHVSNVVERVGFHQSGHDGAQQQVAVPGAARPVTLEDRDRDTGPHGAADIVVPPDHEIRVPVTGTVIRSGAYTLYCDYRDDYAVIEPDAHPGWEVKVLHIDGVAVRKGQRVEAGVTVVAPRATILPFPSQVDDHTSRPAWPHVHVEVVDPSVPDRPTGPGCP